MQNPIVNKAKWKMLGKLPGKNSQNTWSAMKVINKGLQSGTEQTGNEPSALTENLSPYVQNAIAKHVQSVTKAASAVTPTTPAVPQTPQVPTAPASPQMDLKGMWQKAKPLVQGVMEQFNPMNQMMGGASQFMNSGLGQTAMSVLPLLLQGSGGWDCWAEKLLGWEHKDRLW